MTAQSAFSLVPGAPLDGIRVLAVGALACITARARSAVARYPGRPPAANWCYRLRPGQSGEMPGLAPAHGDDRGRNSHSMIAMTPGMLGEGRRAAFPACVRSRPDHRAEQHVSTVGRRLHVVIDWAAAYRIILNAPPATRGLWYIKESAMATAKLGSINAKRRIGQAPRTGLPLEGRPQR